ncbi:hypothetical protein BK699_21920 [Bacillus thuringiensis serovar mexicanensis]|uniref:Resolvase/invertase-type recombinase catalytic domain-containing protein n=1 Tax=Bacillus thuringiensis serovar mexicanensis TaxID=180868 RepID=A0A242W424_BACTU|nr:hypothetical protein BK699_21920 [Bacillus thuringiensis serovar mexicanensis]OTX01017.1 hypothetical protein BK705_19085 [Bacillus thuringiensis serovar monterrey]
MLFCDYKKLGYIRVSSNDQNKEQKINLEFLKELFIIVTYNGNATNDVIQSTIQKASAHTL